MDISVLSAVSKPSDVNALEASEFMCCKVTKIQSFSDVTIKIFFRWLFPNACLLWIKKTFLHLVKWEKFGFDRNNYLEKCDIQCLNLEKTLEYLDISKRLQSEIFTECSSCVKKYFEFFSSTPKHIQKQKMKWIIELGKTLQLFVVKAFQRKVFCSMVMSRSLIPT